MSVSEGVLQTNLWWDHRHMSAAQSEQSAAAVLCSLLTWLIRNVTSATISTAVAIITMKASIVCLLPGLSVQP